MEKKVIQASRIQSPSSIKTYKQCPRKYYYNYILKLPTSGSIHTVRGNIAHSALERFFDIDTSVISLDNYQAHLKLIVQKLLLKEWQNYKEELDKLELTQKKTIFYFEETLIMMFNWVDLFCRKVKKLEGTFQERFNKLTPQRELLFVSEQYQVRGYIDAIEGDFGQKSVRVMDYKTSRRANIDDHLLQLGIYSLLYHEKYGYLPEQVGIYFIKQSLEVERVMYTDEALLDMAKKEIINVHANTLSKEITDYPKQTSPLCKWKTGQCDFYDTCRPHD